MVDHLYNFQGMEKNSPALRVVMPLYHGSLDEALPLSTIEETERAMAQITEGLGFMHVKGALHRDLKPANALIQRKSPIHIRLCDLGWATTIQNIAALRRTCGTPGFAAPEVPK